MSAGSDNINLATVIARLPVPVLIIYGGHDTFVGADKITQIVDERNRLNSALTRSVMISGAGYLEEYSMGKTDYINAVNDYLATYFTPEE